MNPRHVLVALCALAVSIALIPVAHAEILAGQLEDGLTGEPITGASVHVLGTHHRTTTDDEGRWEFELPPGVYEVELRADVFGEIHESRLVNQRVPQVRKSFAFVYTTAFVDRGHPLAAHPIGMPTTSGRIPDDGPEQFDLREAWPGLDAPPALNRYEIPANQPATIRVGRRQDPRQGCSNNPVVAIEEMDLDEYVKGVLPPEIGVFRNITGAAEVYKAFAIAAKSYGLWFILRYGEGGRDLGQAMPPDGHTWFHIDDTACNQRYDDQRLTLTSESSDAVARLIMVKKGATTTIDKYEYAASCGKHGTRPIHQTTLVPDQPPTSACAGTWCGHNTCAAHEDNPSLPAGNRCLVRGICQWGSASWGENGRNYNWLLEHYQPNLELREIGNSSPGMVELTGYVYEDAEDITGSGISGATVTLNDGQSTTSNEAGLFTFAEVSLELGTAQITASKTGYTTNTRDKELEAAATNWGSVQLVRESEPPVSPPVDDPDTGDLRPGSDVGPDDGDVGHVADTAAPQPSGIGPMMSVSPGLEGGCATAPNGPSSPGGLALSAILMVIAGLVSLRRR
ncbi:MAG: carboxypeptidase regulatory-like domain-containing protein [Bradymonadaceae bacterium]